MNFNIDIIIVASYMLFCLVIGLFNYGKIKNIRHYTLGTKSFPTAVLLATTFATAIDARQIIGNMTKVYELGLVFMLPLFFIPISWFILAKVFSSNLETFHKHKFISLSDIMEYWYGKPGRWTTTIANIILAIGITAISAITIGSLLHYFLNISETTGMLIGLIIVTSYSFFGGIMSVAFTDVFQFLIFFVALPVACFIGYQDTGGIKNIWSSLPDTHLQINKGNIILFISFAFYALIPNSGVPYIQRALIAKDKEQFLQTFMSVAILLIPLLIIICLIGLITHYNSPDIAHNKILYHFVDQYLPIGIKGLLITGLLAVIMSTQDSYLNSTSVLIAHDICKQIWPSLTNKQELLIARISCIVIAIASTSLIFFSKGIIETFWLVCNFLDPIVTVPMIAGLIGVRINKKYFMTMVVLSLTTIISIRLITGTFDTRSLVVGMITSALVLYLLHKKHKKKTLFFLPTINLNLLFNKLNARTLSNSFSIASLYKVGIVICLNLGLGIFFTNLSSANILNCSFAVIVSLLILLLLNDLWNYNLKKYSNNIWKFSLIVSLVFIPSYIMFSSDFYIFWLCNFALSITLFIAMSDLVIGIMFASIATSVSYLLSQIFYIDRNLIATEFATISCSATLIAIVIQIYNSRSIAKTIHKKIMHELEDIIRERTGELKQSLNIKEEFLNKLNHELRTPLSVMINTSDCIYQSWDKISDKDKKKFLKDIVDNRDRFEAYTSNILDLADLKQCKFKLNIKPKIDLVQLSKTTIKKATQFILEQDKNLKIELEVKNSNSKIINCDENRIDQVLFNLLLNSIKYSNHGIIKVSINAVKDAVEISVSDEGIGIPDNEKSKIFAPFFEGSRTKSPAEGKGLGLSVAKQIIVLHKGYIRVENNNPKGTIFTFILPSKLELKHEDYLNLHAVS
jgi:solute:Na+ symporter, SSS family